MQLPRQEKERHKLQLYLRGRKDDEGFLVFLSWLKAELHQRDVENRAKGLENPTTEAQALAYILATVAACQVPEADRDQDGSGTESTSAAPLM